MGEFLLTKNEVKWASRHWFQTFLDKGKSGALLRIRIVCLCSSETYVHPWKSWQAWFSWCPWYSCFPFRTLHRHREREINYPVKWTMILSVFYRTILTLISCSVNLDYIIWTVQNDLSCSYILCCISLIWNTANYKKTQLWPVTWL